jgi:hypothetical protein
MSFNSKGDVGSQLKYQGYLIEKMLYILNSILSLFTEGSLDTFIESLSLNAPNGADWTFGQSVFFATTLVTTIGKKTGLSLNKGEENASPQA